MKRWYQIGAGSLLWRAPIAILLRNRSFRDFALLLCVCALAQAQGTTSRVVGTVIDATGLAVTGESTGVAYNTKISGSGLYQFEAIQIGVYTIEVEAQGFKKVTSKGTHLTIGNVMTVNATLQVGSVTEQVEVVGAAERTSRFSVFSASSLASGGLPSSSPPSRRRSPAQMATPAPSRARSDKYCVSRGA